MKTLLRDVAEYGFSFGPLARDWYQPGQERKLARDAALLTSPNTSVPADITAYIDPRVIEILTAPRNAREVYREVKKGDWTTSFARFRAMELVGASEPYSDFARNRTSDVNYNWVTRQNYLFQTVIQYGDLETDISSAAKISLVADKQRAAANTLDLDGNLFYLQGVAGKEVYGILNAPELPSAITPGATGSGGAVTWDAKTPVQIYDDILLLFTQLATQSNGWINANTPLKLALSPAASVYLAKATEFNISVRDMLDKYFRSLKIITLPELGGVTGGETMLMLADEVRGMPTGELGFSEKVRAGRTVPDLSSFAQKWVAGTYGAILYLPFAVAQMRGMMENS